MGLPERSAGLAPQKCGRSCMEKDDGESEPKGQGALPIANRKNRGGRAFYLPPAVMNRIGRMRLKVPDPLTTRVPPEPQPLRRGPRQSQV